MNQYMSIRVNLESKKQDKQKKKIQQQKSLKERHKNE